MRSTLTPLRRYFSAFHHCQHDLRNVPGYLQQYRTRKSDIIAQRDCANLANEYVPVLLTSPATFESRSTEQVHKHMTLNGLILKQMRDCAKLANDYVPVLLTSPATFESRSTEQVHKHNDNGWPDPEVDDDLHRRPVSLVLKSSSSGG
jgi:hypothetical protein